MTPSGIDAFFMDLALAEARQAAAAGEVPTGCVIVEMPPEGTDDPQRARVVARAHNQTETRTDATAHAEILALRQAAAAKGNWRLSGCRLYVTKEPCPMCAGAIVLARPDAVVWGVSDPKRGGSTVFDIFRHPGINHHPLLLPGVSQEPCLDVLRAFFRQRRATARAARALRTPPEGTAET
jgi:tRNA(adenine34) deaminase